MAVDLDPQANLSAMFLEEDRLEELWLSQGRARTVLGPVRPLLEGEGGIEDPHVEPVGDLGLLVGDLSLSGLEDELSQQWPQCLDGRKRAFRVVAAFHEVLSRASSSPGGGTGSDRRRAEPGLDQPVGIDQCRPRGDSAGAGSLLDHRAAEPRTPVEGVAQRVEGEAREETGGARSATGAHEPCRLRRDPACGAAGQAGQGVRPVDGAHPLGLPGVGAAGGARRSRGGRETPAAWPSSSTTAA